MTLAPRFASVVPMLQHTVTTRGASRRNSHKHTMNTQHIAHTPTTTVTSTGDTSAAKPLPIMGEDDVIASLTRDRDSLLDQLDCALAHVRQVTRERDLARGALRHSALQLVRLRSALRIARLALTHSPISEQRRTDALAEIAVALLVSPTDVASQVTPAG